MTAKKGNLIVISGPSGAGKGTVCGEFMKKHPEAYLSVSATTRKPREGEKHGVSYFFITEDEFEARLAKGGFLEHTVYCGSYYGTPRAEAMRQLESGRDVILEIECEGAMKVRSHYPEGVFIFVTPPTEEELEKRLRARGTESEEAIAARLKKARLEFKQAHKYNYLLINDTVDAAVKDLEAIVEAEKGYMPRNIDFVNNFFKEEK